MTVRQLLAEMDSRELSEWAAYDLVEPFGPWREDLRSGIVASTVANALRGRNGRSYKPTDFLPTFDGSGGDGERMTTEETIAAFAAAFGAKR